MGRIRGVTRRRCRNRNARRKRGVRRQCMGLPCVCARSVVHNAKFSPWWTRRAFSQTLNRRRNAVDSAADSVPARRRVDSRWRRWRSPRSRIPCDSSFSNLPILQSSRCRPCVLPVNRCPLRTRRSDGSVPHSPKFLLRSIQNPQPCGLSVICSPAGFAVERNGHSVARILSADARFPCTRAGSPGHWFMRGMLVSAENLLASPDFVHR